MDQGEFTCVPIVGARTVDQLEENLGAAAVSITRDQHDRITDARYDEDGRRWGH
jgi:aryl-alcohol dehydrogenase-like predicted oxidoreductase